MKIKLFRNEDKEVFENEVNQFLRDNPYYYVKRNRNNWPDKFWTLILISTTVKKKEIDQIKCIFGTDRRIEKELNKLGEDIDFLYLSPRDKYMKGKPVYYMVIISYPAFKRINKKEEVK